MVLTLRNVLCTISEQTAYFTLYVIKGLGFYNRGGQCLLRGAHWVVYKTEHFVFKGLICLSYSLTG
jgi:hypothetical protein